MAIAGRGPTVVEVMWVETAIAFIVVSLRFYSRKYLSQSEGLDDYLIVISCFMLMSDTVGCTAAAAQGFGQHSADLTIEELSNAIRSNIIGQTFCLIGIATSKASVSVFLLRLAVVKWHRLVLYFTMFAVSGIAITCALLAFIRCDPIAHVWNPQIPAKCWVSIEQLTALSIAVGGEDNISHSILKHWLISHSHLLSSRLSSCGPAMDHTLEPEYKEERQDSHHNVDEFRCPASHPGFMVQRVMETQAYWQAVLWPAAR
ncbi:hypothetical protein DSL72_007402 [Monilinia vaccinii-corymbosi]|uniref:Rhodopsin domain-containing protein n=1 Tax=Monilinia vaccinii-corymbosi TaxID=61207 RepID=A0A8A3PN70_9HELO|nr:hypothetical protein DSL72_007402 [Monilinia vaccinii-corymbosi]